MIMSVNLGLAGGETRDYVCQSRFIYGRKTVIMSVNLGQIDVNLESAAIWKSYKVPCSQRLTRKSQIDVQSGRQSRNLAKRQFFQDLSVNPRFTENPPHYYVMRWLWPRLRWPTPHLIRPPVIFISSRPTVNLKGVCMPKIKIVHTIDFVKPPKIGTVFLLEGQRYEVIDLLVHTRRDDAVTMLILWRGFCADCGTEFTFKTGLRAKSVNRRCDNHKRPGKPVSAKGRRRQRLFIRNNRRKSS